MTEMRRYDFSRLSVMIVDDNRMMRALLQSLLDSFGVGSVIRAGNGEDALHILANEPVDIVITDWLMSPLDGLEFVRAVRTGKTSPNRLVPILMMTGLSEMWRVAAARDMGVNGFIVKPLTGESLLSRIIHIIEHPRFFIRTRTYLGPDRRRAAKADYGGPERRGSRTRQPPASPQSGEIGPTGSEIGTIAAPRTGANQPHH